MSERITFGVILCGHTLDKTSLMYIRHDCLSTDGTGDGAKAWRFLQQRYSNVEKPTDSKSSETIIAFTARRR